MFFISFIVIAISLSVIFLSGCISQGESITDSPKNFSNSKISFEYPGNWKMIKFSDDPTNDKNIILYDCKSDSQYSDDDIKCVVDYDKEDREATLNEIIITNEPFNTNADGYKFFRISSAQIISKKEVDVNGKKGYEIIGKGIVEHLFENQTSTRMFKIVLIEDSEEIGNTKTLYGTVVVLIHAPVEQFDQAKNDADILINSIKFNR
jgi:hypothetical protein